MRKIGSLPEERFLRRGEIGRDNAEKKRGEG